MSFLDIFQELNPSVEGSFDLGNPEDIITRDMDFLRQFAVIVGCNLNIDVATRINDFLFEKNIPFVYARLESLLERVLRHIYNLWLYRAKKYLI